MSAVQLTPFGQEHTSYITGAFLRDCAKEHMNGTLSKDEMFMKLVSAIFFNQDHPENINVKKEGGISKVWNGSDWEERHDAYVVDQMMMKAKEVLAGYLLACDIIKKRSREI